ALAVDEGDEQPSRLRAQYFLQDARFEIELELVARRILTVFQQARIATTGGCAAAFLDVVIGRIRKAQDCLTEVLAELVLFREQLQTLALGFQRRIEDKVPVSGEHCARD